jgi:protein involved in polysaccharide export with SLBB domain
MSLPLAFSIKSTKLGLTGVMVFLMVACATSEPSVDGPVNASSTAPSSSSLILAAGHKLMIEVSGRDDLSGIVPISENGNIGHPRIGEIQAAGLSPFALENVIRDRLRENGLAANVVRIEIINLRPVYVIGEVLRDGEYPYSMELNLAEAINQAGGYTYRADTQRAFVTRQNNNQEQEVIINSTDALLPGDIVRVPQQYF